ncbi:MAG: hypothetical protein ACKO0N_13005 [Planctomycetota bacterium]
MRALKEAPSERRGNPQTSRKVREAAVGLEDAWRYQRCLSLVIHAQPEGKRYGRGADICAAWDAAMKLTKSPAKPRKKGQKISD